MTKDEKLLELELESIILDIVSELDHDFYKGVDPDTPEDVATNKIQGLVDLLRNRLEKLKLIPSRHDT